MRSLLPEQLWNCNTLFVEIGARSGVLGARLAEAGCTKYLAVAPNRRVAEAVRQKWPELAKRVATTTDQRIVLHNNADVLILSGRSAAALWQIKQVRHATQVAWSLSLSPWCLLATLGWLIRFLARQYRWPRLVRCRGAKGPTQRLLVSDVVRVKRCYHHALHFIPHVWGAAGLFAALGRQEVDYVVLRSFDALPDLPPGADLDLLISDDDHRRVLDLLRSEPGFLPCDVYTPSGLPRTDHGNTSYYPPLLARRLLENSRDHRGICRVPNEDDHFCSLAYHAVYHKGAKSGLPGAEQFCRPGYRGPEKYAVILRAMAARRGIDVEISLEGLHRWLQANGWAPPADLITRMAAHHPRSRWLRRLAEAANENAGPAGLAVFVVRQEAIDLGVGEQIEEQIAAAGFRLLHTKRLSPTEIAYGAPRTRGGNWGPGPGAQTGGLPAWLIVAYDPLPLLPTRKQHRRHPLMTNARVLVKDEIREAINARLPAGRQINALHSSDYPAEAYHLVEVFAPEMLDALATQIEADLTARSLPLAA